MSTTDGDYDDEILPGDSDYTPPSADEQFETFGTKLSTLKSKPEFETDQRHNILKPIETSLADLKSAYGTGIEVPDKCNSLCKTVTEGYMQAMSTNNKVFRDGLHDLGLSAIDLKVFLNRVPRPSQSGAVTDTQSTAVLSGDELDRPPSPPRRSY
nr:hypothetical protein L203_06427 [Cryptococcus depauperatus CBS 7841]